MERGLRWLRIWRIYGHFFKTSLIADLQFRTNFMLQVLGDSIWYCGQVFIFEVLIKHTQTMGTWSAPQIRVFLGIVFLADALFMIFFHENLSRLTDKVRKGDLDLYLTKPISSQFFLSFQRVGTSYVINFFFGMIWLGYSLRADDLVLPSGDWSILILRGVWCGILMIAGLMIHYAVRFILLASSVIFTQSDNLQFLWYNAYRLGLRPHKMYLPWLRFLVTMVIPVAMIASIPTEALLDSLNWENLIWPLVVAGGLVWTSTVWWKFCLKRYASASS